MSQKSPEVVWSALVLLAVSLAPIPAVFIAARVWPRARPAWERLWAEWKPAAAVAVIYLASSWLGGTGFNLFGLTVMFCQSLMGLALARSIAGFEPLRVTRSIRECARPAREFIVLIVVALLFAVLAQIVGALGTGVGAALGETKPYAEVSGEATALLPTNKWMMLFTLLAGAGIFEETMFRLLLQSLAWRLTRRRWVGVLFSAVMFGAYHLSPLNGMSRVFWQIPISQFLASVFIGIVWSYLFIKRGYETVVLSHTLSDWVPVVLFMR